MINKVAEQESHSDEKCCVKRSRQKYGMREKNLLVTHYIKAAELVMHLDARRVREPAVGEQ
jgi:hypothetical protein